MTRAEGKAETLARLRSAGRAALLDLGIDRASIQDITARAGIATGSFYVHFPSKAAFVDSLVDDLNQGLVQRMLGNLMSATSIAGLLDAMAQTVVDYWSENVSAIPLFTDHLTRHASEEILLFGTNKQSVAMVKKLVQSLPQLELRTAPDFLVASLVALWRVSALYAAALPPDGRRLATRDLVRATRALLDTFLPGIFEVELKQILAGLAP